MKKILLILASCILIIGITGSLYIIHQHRTLGLNVWEIIQNLANPTVRYVKITEGIRKEEVANRFASVLGWKPSERQKLLDLYTTANNGKSEGYYFPATYIVPIHATVGDVVALLREKFNEEVLYKNIKLKNKIINMDTAIKIASIIQREAKDKTDMGIISGVIWNRIFQGMSLDMDATLQYAKGNNEKWWPRVVPDDKNIDSPYNTYKHKGLPPTAISNPGPAAIDAALNPTKTTAIFYIHDNYGNIHTARTYQQHKDNIAKYY